MDRLINSREILIPVTMGIMINLVSGYLFTLQKINLTWLMFIVIGSALIILIISIQIKTDNSMDKIDSLESKQQKLEEKLKIHEQLINIKSDIKELQKGIFKNE
jgi:hypothetical protein